MTIVGLMACHGPTMGVHVGWSGRYWPLGVGTMGQGIQDGVVSLPLITRQALGRAWAILYALVQYVSTAGCDVMSCDGMTWHVVCVVCACVFGK